MRTLGNYRGNRSGGSRTQEAPPSQNGNGKNPPVKSWKLWSPGGTLEVAIFETVKKTDSGKEYVSFFVSVNRSFANRDGKFEDTNLLNPPDLLQVAEMLKIAWDWICENSNRE